MKCSELLQNTHGYMQLQIPHDYKVDLPAVDIAAAVVKLGTVGLLMCMKYFTRKSLH